MSSIAPARIPGLPSWDMQIVEGDHGQDYVVQQLEYHGKSFFTCSCASFKWSSGHEHARTCKHIARLLGRLDQLRLQQDYGALLPIESPSFTLAMDAAAAGKYTGWIMSEKLDGARAMWDGRNFVTRGGRKVVCPEHFSDGLPEDMCLDGELWIDFNSRPTIVGLINRKKLTSEALALWGKVNFTIFDHMTAEGDFVTRWNLVRQRLGSWERGSVAALSSDNHLHIAEHTACRSQAHLDQVLAEVAAHDGEGIILRDGTQPYIHGRTKALRRVLCSGRPGTPPPEDSD